MAAERPFWAGGAAPEEREKRLLVLAVGALRDLESEEDLLAALRTLAAHPLLRSALGPDQALALASYAAVGDLLSPTGEAALRVLAAAGRTEGLSTLRARLEAAPDERDRTLLVSLLEATFAAAPLDAVLPSADGASGEAARVAAVRSLGSRDGTDQRVLSAVRRATSAERPSARAAGYVALARLRPAEALEILRFAANGEPDAEARVGALEGLGVLGGPEVVALLGRALASPEAWVRAAAVRGLAASREPEGLSFVLTALTSDGDASVRSEAEKAVQALGGDRAREALRAVAIDRRRDGPTRLRAVEGLGQLGAEGSLADLRALLADPVPEVADAAAFALAWIRDGEAAPRVLEALREDRNAGRALLCMELLSLESFRAVRDRGEALSLYTGWYEVSRSRGPRGWLAEALEVRGLGDGALKELETGGNPRAAVPALLKAFEDSPWYLRRAADLELRRISGTKSAEIGPWTTEAEARGVQEAWNAWWERERGAKR
ncbi:MAG: HEAT repeat domain-containing protein [Planctomycetes bacterium]|nr:HEAT repeat domain-containing protein [Planctomycetota bacterium]